MIAPLHDEVQRINHVFALAGGLSPEEEILSHWARYLCVLTAGLIETGARLLCIEYVRLHASPDVEKFVSMRLRNLGNLNTERLQQLLGEFSDDWRQDFDREITDAQKEAINSVLANRHGIAHGRPVGISLVRVKGYYTEILGVLEWMSRKLIGA